MKIDSIVWVKIEASSYYNILLKLNEMGITVFDNKKYDDYILLKTTYKDYKKIKKYLISYKIYIYSKSGIGKIKEFLNKYLIFTSSVILGIFILILANNIILKVEVKSPNQEIRELLVSELKKYNLGVLKLKKDHKKVEKIVENILDNNKNILEWMEVRYDGLILVVNVTEKTITEDSNKYDYCHIIAKTDAKISSMNIYRGVSLKEINDYVLKGDIILSGEIIHNEEVKNLVCASGEIYGEVWYKVKVEVPFNESSIKYTGKNRYNLNFKINDKTYQIFKSRIEKKMEEETNLYKLNDFEINLVKEKEYVTKVKKISEKDAYNKGISLALEKVKIKLDDNEEIILQKVLKKQVNDSTIYLEIFIVTKENIGELQILEKEEEHDNKSIYENNQ